MNRTDLIDAVFATVKEDGSSLSRAEVDPVVRAVLRHLATLAFRNTINLILRQAAEQPTS